MYLYFSGHVGGLNKFLQANDEKTLFAEHTLFSVYSIISKYDLVKDLQIITRDITFQLG